MAPDAGTYFYHCHITPPEHLQMGMVGQLYVRPRQNRVPVGTSLYSSLELQQTDRKSTRLNSSHVSISYAVFCLKKKKKKNKNTQIYKDHDRLNQNMQSTIAT